MLKYIRSLSVWALIGLVVAVVASLFSVPAPAALICGVAVLGLRAVVVDAYGRRVSPVLAVVIAAAIATCVVVVLGGTSPWALAFVAAAMLLTRHWATEEVDGAIQEVNALVTHAASWVRSKVRSRRASRIATVEEPEVPAERLTGVMPVVG